MLSRLGRSLLTASLSAAAMTGTLPSRGADDWPCYRHDDRLTGRSALSCSLTGAPVVVAEYYLGAAPGTRVVTPEIARRPRANTADLDGDGETEVLSVVENRVAIKSQQGAELFTYDLPEDQRITQIRLARVDPGTRGLQAVLYGINVAKARPRFQGGAAGSGR